MLWRFWQPVCDRRGAGLTHDEYNELDGGRLPGVRSAAHAFFELNAVQGASMSVLRRRWWPACNPKLTGALRRSGLSHTKVGQAAGELRTATLFRHVHSSMQGCQLSYASCLRANHMRNANTS